MRRLRLLVLLAVAACLSMPAFADPEPSGALRAVEAEFREAIRVVTPATVTLVPHGAPRLNAGFSSGVIVSPDGLVLSDGDVGLIWERRRGKSVKTWRDDVDVRVPGPSPGFKTYRARVLFRDTDVDTSLLRITSPHARPFPHVPVGFSDAVEVGDFAFALGTAFDEDGKAPATLTAGLIASTEPFDEEGGAGRHAFLYTSAAVNQGVNGGPLVDLDGRLVGTISTWVPPDPDARHQLLGKAVPIDRIRAVCAHVAGATAALAPRTAPEPKDDPARALQTAFRAAGRTAARAVVSLTIHRVRPVSSVAPVEGREVELPRFQGPVSGVLVSADGWIVTSLYNLTNVGSLVEPVWTTPRGAGLAEGLADVRSVTVHLPGGATAPARLAGHDRRLGIALLEADLSKVAAASVRTLEPAPPDAFQTGRFVVTAGNPFGGAALPDPLLTVGILSREHPDDAVAAWRGQWQTDAAGLDTNSGGAAVDLEGRLLGLFTLWFPVRHGRGSGVAFIVPWRKIEAALPALKRGAGPEAGFLGVRFARGAAPRLRAVIGGTAAARAGLRPGDIVLRVDREEVPTLADAVAAIGHRCAGDRVALTIKRAGAVMRLEVILGRRGEPAAPR